MDNIAGYGRWVLAGDERIMERTVNDMKTLAIYFILTASVIADTLPELVAQAKADGIGTNLVAIAKYLNSPQGYTTTTTTNIVTKPAGLIAIESAILAEIVSTGIDSTATGWTYRIDLTRCPVWLRGMVPRTFGVQRDGEPINADFGQPTSTVVGRVRVANPSLAVEHLGRPVTIEELQ